MSGHIRMVLWRNRAQENLESCSLIKTEDGLRLTGATVMKETNLPMSVEYHVDCTPDWKTQYIALDAWRGDHQPQR